MADFPAAVVEALAAEVPVEAGNKKGTQRVPFLFMLILRQQRYRQLGFYHNTHKQ